MTATEDKPNAHPFKPSIGINDALSDKDQMREFCTVLSEDLKGSST